MAGRSRTRCGTVRPARLRTVVLNQHHHRDLLEHGSGPEPGPHSGPESGRPSNCSNAVPATRRDRCRGVPGTNDGAAAAAAPRSSSRWWGVTTTAGAGAAPAPGTSNNVATGAADSAAPSAATYAGEAMTAWVSTCRRCAWSSPMSTADSGPPSASPNWSKTARDNRRQPVTTGGENSFGPVSPCERPAAKRPSKSHHGQHDRYRDDRRQPVQWRHRQPADLRVDRGNRS